jgi:hypothetical protein
MLYCKSKPFANEKKTLLILCFLLHNFSFYRFSGRKPRACAVVDEQPIAVRQLQRGRSCFLQTNISHNYYSNHSNRYHEKAIELIFSDRQKDLFFDAPLHERAALSCALESRNKRRVPKDHNTITRRSQGRNDSSAFRIRNVGKHTTIHGPRQSCIKQRCCSNREQSNLLSTTKKTQMLNTSSYHRAISKLMCARVCHGVNSQIAEKGQPGIFGTKGAKWIVPVKVNTQKEE